MGFSIKGVTLALLTLSSISSTTAAWRVAEAQSVPNPRAFLTPADVAEGPTIKHPGTPREFYFTRAIYSGYRWYGRLGSWATDWPKADKQFLMGVQRLLPVLDAFESDHPVRLDDPGLYKYPFLYALEVGAMALTEPEVLALRRYLYAGGFLVIDDFWGSYQWANFETEIKRVLPGRPIVDIPLSHPLFHSFYNISELVQVPNVGQGRCGGHTSEQDGYTPFVKGIFDEQNRLMVVINWNSDLGDAWEWAENPYYCLKYSTYAYEMGLNLIVYGMSH